MKDEQFTEASLDRKFLYISTVSQLKVSACQCRRHKRGGFNLWVRKTDPLEEEMAIHSSILAWRIPWTEEPGGLRFPWDHTELDTQLSTQVTMM